MDGCGAACWHPHWMRKFANTRWFMIVYGLLGTIQATSSLYFVITLTTIERRFKIPSQTTGEQCYCNCEVTAKAKVETMTSGFGAFIMINSNTFLYRQMKIEMYDLMSIVISFIQTAIKINLFLTVSPHISSAYLKLVP